MASGASAAYSCSYDGVTDTLSVNLSGFEEVVALRRDGTDIEVTNDVMGGELTCTSSPAGLCRRSTTRRRSSWRAPRRGAGRLLDLKKGPMGPGTDIRVAELSEIEIDVEWPDGFFGLGGGNNADRFMFGESSRSCDDDEQRHRRRCLPRQHPDDPPAWREGQRQAERQGRPGFLAPIGIFMTIEGGPGDDKMTGAPAATSYRRGRRGQGEGRRRQGHHRR